MGEQFFYKCPECEKVHEFGAPGAYFCENLKCKNSETPLVPFNPEPGEKPSFQKWLCNTCGSILEFEKGQRPICLDPKCASTDMEKYPKYYYVNYTIIKKNILAGAPQVGYGQAIMDKHPLVYAVEEKRKGNTVQIQNWQEIPQDVYQIYFDEMAKEVGKKTLIQAVGNVEKLKLDKH